MAAVRVPSHTGSTAYAETKETSLDGRITLMYYYNCVYDSSLNVADKSPWVDGAESDVVRFDYNSSAGAVGSVLTASLGGYIFSCNIAFSYTYPIVYLAQRSAICDS